MSSSSEDDNKLLVGVQMMQKYFGAGLLADLQAKSARNDMFTTAGQEYIAEVCFSSYARPGLSFRERCLMNIAMLAALNRGPELRIHIRAAIHTGLNEEEVCEACRHAMVYCGVPAGRDALGIASEVFETVGAGSQAKSSKI
ncbi:AhpD-like protein [Aspergillus multicolor]|uniref:AhpD-like protein n=1 Tax=Aspergillus multicolor TaxID=41759 RepID=UPI003CCE07EC